MTYSTRQDSEDLFGKDNIRKWADLDNNDKDADITSRINRAIAYAYRRINSKLKFGPYEVPFTSPIDEVIVDLSARIVGIWLYDNRGIVDSDPAEFDQLARHRKHIKTIFAEINGLRVILDYDLVSTAYPLTVADQ